MLSFTTYKVCLPNKFNSHNNPVKYCLPFTEMETEAPVNKLFKVTNKVVKSGPNIL